jgi:hypothetical protein
MDAIIFFVACTIVCSVVLRESGFSGQTTAPISEVDAQESLRVILSASIGVPVPVSGPAETTLRPDTPVGDCIAFEILAISSGAPRSCFEDLDEAVFQIMCAVSGSAISPYIVVYSHEALSGDPALAIPETPPVAADVAAASLNIPGVSGAFWLLVLLLLPAAPPEL